MSHLRGHTTRSELNRTTGRFESHLYEVDDVIGQPKQGEGAYDHQDEAAPLRSALEAGALQAADHRGVAGVDEGERHQAAHNSLKQVLEGLVAHAAPVIWPAKCYRDVVGQRDLLIAVGPEEEMV